MNREQRLSQIVEVLARHDGPAAVPAIAGMFGVSVRTVRSDVGLLRDRGFEIATIRGRAGGLQLLGAGSREVGRDSGLFVGHADEVASLEAAYEVAESGESATVLISGEAGIGKTTLARHFSDMCRARGSMVLWGTCSGDQGAPPFWPWIQIIRDLLSAPDALSTLDGVLQIGRLASFDDRFGELGGDFSAPQEETPSVVRHRMFETVASAIAAVAVRRPVVIVVDDLHWADRSSIDLLNFLGGNLADSKILMLGTTRDHEVGGAVDIDALKASVARARNTRQIQVKGLTVEAVVALLSAESSGADIQQVFELTQGNPLFVKELGRLNESGSGNELDVSGAISGVIGRRLDLVDEGLSETLGLLSVAGRAFNIDAVGEAFGGAQQELMRDLAEIESHRIIRHVGNSGMLWEFEHPLIHRVAYDRLDSAIRTETHARLGRCYVSIFGDELGERASEAALHFQRGAPLTDVAEAVVVLKQAGEWALQALAFTDAEDHFTAALNLVPGSDHPRRAPLLDGLAAAEQGTDTYHDSTAMRDAYDSYVAMGDHKSAVRIAQSPQLSGNISGVRAWIEEAIPLAEVGSSDEATLHSRLGWAIGFDFGNYDYEQANAALTRAADIADRVGDRTALGWAYGRASQNSAFDWRWDDSVTFAEASVEAGAAFRDPILSCHAYQWATSAAAMTGRLENARIYAGACREWAELTGDQFRLRTAIRGEMNLLVWQGQWWRFLELNSEAEFPEWASGVAFLGEYRACMELGDEMRAIKALDSLSAAPPITSRTTLQNTDHLSDIIAGYRLSDASFLVPIEHPRIYSDYPGWREPAGAYIAWIFNATMLAERGRDVSEARHLYSTLKDLFPEEDERSDARFKPGIVDRVLGILAATQSEIRTAEGHFIAAFEFAERGGYSPEFAWTVHDYMKALDGSGIRSRHSDLARLADAAIVIADDLEMVVLRSRLQGLRDELQLSQAVSSDLTDREHTVLRLLTRGMSNGEIAGELTLSPHTVAEHVAHLLQKLGAQNRAHAAAEAVRRGLA